MSFSQKSPIGAYGAAYTGAIDFAALARAHRTIYHSRETLSVDGNTAAAIPFLQWSRAPIVAGFPITPATKWLEYLATEIASGKLDVELDGKKLRPKRVKLLESEHATADYLVGVASACRGLIVGTATSSVGLDHMTETVRSIGASGLGNIVLVNVCRATANYPLCIEGDPSDHLAHRDDGFIQYMNRGKQQIYDALLQLPAVGMHPSVLTPVMPAYFGIKDSHRAGKLVVEPDERVNEFLERALALGRTSETPPGLLDGDTSMGNCVTSAWFQGFKSGQKARMQRALEVLPAVSRLFEEMFDRPGLSLFEEHGMEDRPEVVLVTMGPDAGTAVHLLPKMAEQLKMRIGLIVLRLITPFPSAALLSRLAGTKAIGVVNHAHHHGRGHLTLDVADVFASAGAPAPPIESFFCGLGGADVSMTTWLSIAKTTCEAATRGKPAQPWHLIHDGLSVETTSP